MNRRYDFACLCLGSTGAHTLQQIFDHCPAVFVPPHAVSDLADTPARLGTFIPGNSQSEMSPWPWVLKTGLLIRAPTWNTPVSSVLREATTGDLLLHIVSDPRAEIATAYRCWVRAAVMDQTKSANGPITDRNWLARLADLDLFLAHHHWRCLYDAQVADLVPAFDRYIVFDSESLTNTSVYKFATDLTEILDCPLGHTPAPLVETASGRQHLRNSETVLTIYGVPLPVLVAYADDTNPKGDDSFDYTLAHVEYADAIAHRRQLVAFEQRAFSVRTHSWEYMKLPRRLRRAMSSTYAIEQTCRDKLLGDWFAQVEEIEKLVRMILVRADFNYLTRRLLELIATDLECFLARNPGLRKAWAM